MHKDVNIHHQSAGNLGAGNQSSSSGPGGRYKKKGSSNTNGKQ